MSDTTIRINRHPDSSPGTWWWMDSALGPVVCCPGCQQPHLLDIKDAVASHTVASDGTVTPAVRCTQCGWNKNVRLDGWTGGPCR